MGAGEPEQAPTPTEVNRSLEPVPPPPQQAAPPPVSQPPPPTTPGYQAPPAYAPPPQQQQAYNPPPPAAQPGYPAPQQNYNAPQQAYPPPPPAAAQPTPPYAQQQPQPVTGQPVAYQQRGMQPAAPPPPPQGRPAYPAGGGMATPLLGGAIYSHYSVMCTCGNCQHQVNTRTMKTAGTWAMVVAVGLCLFGLCLCAWIPFVMQDFMDTTHICPNCGYVLAKVNRM
eukprot:TRINITY_DN68653_c0_g1_i1.p2 TRINITY_DN68653_c0_g1~~TRINITY_DN68653_c0_g1_i1.p2  ORF type:complete len:225 (-),score=54.49 TRINITY_DN68653_c0_g1_i1:131-805(-)